MDALDLACMHSKELAVKHALMHKSQRSDVGAVWSVEPGTSMTLAAHRHRRLLQACEGRLWVTTEGTDQDAALDVWLLPGETVALEPGVSVVLEGWPSARFRVLVPAMAAEARPRWSDRIVRAWMRLRVGAASALPAGA